MTPSIARHERGAITIHVALALIALLTFSSMVIDYGVMWLSRRQAQNAADSGALAGASSLLKDGGSTPNAKVSAETFAANNAVLGQANVPGGSGNIVVAVSGSGAGEQSVPPCGNVKGCVRVDVLRNEPDRLGTVRGDAIPTFFSKMAGIGAQGVRATGTARTGSGNLIQCLLPFAVIDRWADNYDPTPVTTYFPNDAATGIAGWTPNDDFQPAQGDVYIPPYDGNPNHTGWKVTVDYGRQLILKDGSPGNYSSGWSNLVYLPGSGGGSGIRNDIEHCNQLPVGLSTAANPCTSGDEAHGCIDVAPGNTVGPVKQGIDTVVDFDGGAHWDPSASGPNALPGAVVGGLGMDTPRIRPLAVVDINHYVASGCSGGTCVTKVANIIGFFLEGICNTVTLDPGLSCDDPSKDIVGRIVTLPGKYATGTGSVEQSAAFITIVQLVR